MQSITSSATNVAISLRVNGKDIVTYQHEGRHYVEAKEGTEYSIHLRNNNPFRVKTVVAVDGVSVLSGKPAGEVDTEAGYIMAAHETLEVKGYRLDNQAVAAFRFTKATQGYAQAEKGLTGTTGVIGVRVFKEKVIPVVPQPKVVIKEVHHHHNHWDYWYPWNRPTVARPMWLGDGYHYTYGSTTDNTALGGTLNRSVGLSALSFNASSHCVAPSDSNTGCTLNNMDTSAAAISENSTELNEVNPFTLGSTFGSKLDSHITEVTFTSEVCLGVLELYYTDRQGLLSLGIDLKKTPKVSFPTAFSNKFCSPPPGWQG